MNRIASHFLLIFLLFLCGCSGSKIKFTKDPIVIENPNKSAPLTCFVDFDTEIEPQKISFTIDDSERKFQLQYLPSEKTKNGYLIYMMRPAMENSITIEITDKAGAKHQFQKILKFNTPHLPEDDLEFPRIEIARQISGKEQEDLILFNPRRRIPMNQPNSNELNKTFGMLAVCNKKGDVLWFFRIDSRISDFDLLENGNLSFMTQDSRICEIDFSGKIINQWYASGRPEGKMDGAIAIDAQTFHHDVSILPNGNRLVCSTEIKEIDNYYTSERDKEAPRKLQKVMGDVILEFTPEGDVVHRWSSFDEMPVMRIGYETFSNYWHRRGFPGVIDWSHANAVVPLPNEDAYLVNYRYQSAMIKVNKTKGKIEWIFAEPSGWGEELKHKLLKISEDGWNWHQHSPHFTANGNLLFFNNNNYKARPFNPTAPMLESPSYVVEYKINETNKTVERIWDSNNKKIPPVISIAMGRVSELPQTGNILACYGALLSPDHMEEMTWWNRGGYPQWTMVREFSKTTPAQIIWEMRVLARTPVSKAGWTLFGANQIELDGYTFVN